SSRDPEISLFCANSHAASVHISASSSSASGKCTGVRVGSHTTPRVILRSGMITTTRGKPMLSPCRLAGIAAVIFAVCGPAKAQELAPAESGVSVTKLSIDSGGTHTVRYTVTNGSPRLQALVRRVEWAENELSVIEQLQMLKLDTVVNERRVASFRTAQL